MIDRKQILWGITGSEDKLFLSRMCDLAQKAENTGRIMYSRFLNPGQRQMVCKRLSQYCDVRFFGGYDDADRCVAAFGTSQWEDTCYPIKALKLIPAS